MTTRTSMAVVLAMLLLALGCTTTPPIDQTASRTMVESAITTSPNGQLSIEVGITAAGEPVYLVESAGTTVIDHSRLGLETSAGSLATDLELVDEGSTATVVDAFELPTGKEREAEIAASMRTITFAAASGATESGGSLGLEIDVWASDEAVAFRSRITGTAGELVTVEWERTSFAMSAEGSSWLLPYDRPTRFTPAYEAFFTNGLPTADPGSADGGWGFPALFTNTPSTDAPLADGAGADERDELWVLLSEAGLTADHAASRLGPQTLDGEFVLSLPDQAEGDGVGERAPTAELPIETPWRVAIIGDLDTVVSSNTVRHLGVSPGGAQGESDARPTPSWIVPGRVSWSWWADHDSSRNADALAEYIEFAAEIGWEYSLIDANWNEIPDAELAELIDLADRSDVGLFLWYNSGGPNNEVTEAPRDLMFDRDARRQEFARIAELGIAGVKVDFFHSDKQEAIGRYLGILEDAAEFELLVNFHGSTIPRGWERRFPNLMTMESVRGAETYTFDPRYAANAATHNTILPFTRNVIGSMDYTPVIFSDDDSVGRLTTDGHELALSVVFESGLQHFVDTPDSYRSQPGFVIDFLADVPTVWDETVLLDGFPGSHAAVARRHLDTWYIGAINGTDQPVDVTLDLGRLGDGSAIETPIELICDAPDGRDGVAESTLEPATTAITTITLRPYGGCVATT